MKTAVENNLRPSGGAVLYCWTNASEAEGRLQLVDQEQLCREYCARSNTEVLARFLDTVEPGRKADRPGLLRMIGFVVRNRARVGRVVVPRLDGFASSSAELDLIVAILGQQGVALEGIAGQVESARNDSLIAPLEAYLGACESASTSARTREGIRAARRSGLPTNSPPVGYVARRSPEGYREIVPDPETAPIVSEAFRLAASGDMARGEIVRRLGQAGARLSPRASRLTWKALRRILANRMYVGLVRISSDEGWIKGCFEPLVDQQTFDEAQRKMDHCSDG